MKTKETAETTAWLDPKAPLREAARILDASGVGSLPVVERGKIVGILSDHDIVARTVAAGVDPGSSTVGDVMTRVPARGGGDDGRARVASLAKGELAAVETYRMALAKFPAGRSAKELRRIVREHADAARLLREWNLDLDPAPPDAPGLWGAFAAAVEGAAQMFGETAALKALKEGEEHGVRRFREALDDERVGAEVKELICGVLLPRTWSHVSALERLLNP